MTSLLPTRIEKYVCSSNVRLGHDNHDVLIILFCLALNHLVISGNLLTIVFLSGTMFLWFLPFGMRPCVGGGWSVGIGGCALGW